MATKTATKPKPTKPKKPEPKRLYRITRDVKAGCYDCSGDRVKWRGPGAHGVAVRHHDHTDHITWVKTATDITYGEGEPEDEEETEDEAPAVTANGKHTKPKKKKAKK